MATKTKSTDEVTARLLQAAREIINETGDFDLPMRALASRAQVSLRTPYQIFGSKSGMITAILKEDQAIFRQIVAQLHSRDQIDNLFERLELAIGVFKAKQAFYRALFRATQGYSGGDETEPARENARGFRILTQRAIAAGLLRADLDAAAFGETLTDIFASNLRLWAASERDIERIYPQIAFGISIALAGVATPQTAERMHAQALRYQAQIVAGRGEGGML